MPRKNLTITLYMSELIYDFQNKAFLTGRSRRAADMDAEAASNIQASDDDEDKNQALRSIQNAYSQLLVELSEAIEKGSGTTASNKLISDTDNIIINLSLPSNYSLGLKDALTSSIHDYIINKAKDEISEQDESFEDVLTTLEQNRITTLFRSGG